MNTALFPTHNFFLINKQQNTDSTKTTMFPDSLMKPLKSYSLKKNRAKKTYNIYL